MRSFWSAWLLAAAVPAPLWAEDAAIRFDPKEPMTDEVVVTRVTGLTPGSECRVRARADFGGKVWESAATYRADDRGAVDLGRQAPVNGSYTGVDPMGLFWSMGPTKEDANAAPAKLADPRVTSFAVESGDKTVARADLTRWQLRPGVRVTAVNEKGLAGKLFEPAGKERRPGLLVLSGSEGGVSEAEAALLASHGYVAFALAYFRAEGLPQQLVKIPLEYLKAGIDWLATRDSVDAKRLGVVGGSKGGELALVLAAHFPELKAVVARAPSSVVWFGLGGTYRESSWTYGGKPLPHLLPPGGPAPKAGKGPIRFVDLYGRALDDGPKAAGALIPVDKVRGAVLLVSGTDDAMWPASRMADQVVGRLKETGHPFPFDHLKYEGAGHAIPSASVPARLTLEAGGMAFGGSAEANARAQADSRPKILRFLKENLKER